jgi:Fe2+ or Zn2+ uptake regulation protein
MKLKPIKDGMVVHCKTEDEAKELIKWAHECGYGTEIPDCWKHYNKHTCYRFYTNYWTYESNVYFESVGCKITEFSDLIIPEEQEEHMSAEEVLEWLQNHTNDTVFDDVFGNNVATLYDVLELYSAKRIYEKIESYEAEKKQEKEVEVEWVYRVYNYKENKDEFVDCEDSAINRCQELVKANPENYAKYEKVCRAKTE